MIHNINSISYYGGVVQLHYKEVPWSSHRDLELVPPRVDIQLPPFLGSMHSFVDGRLLHDQRSPRGASSLA